MSSQPRYVGKPEVRVGWRIWNRKTKRWWGNFFAEYPEAVLTELNSEARPEVLAQLCRSSKSRQQIGKAKSK